MRLVVYGSNLKEIRKKLSERALDLKDSVEDAHHYTKENVSEKLTELKNQEEAELQEDIMK